MTVPHSEFLGIPEVYRGKRVLITGHTGFKGAWLCAWLLELGAKVAGYALEPPSDPSLFDRIGLASRIDHRTGDVRDFPKVRRTLDEVRPNILLHLAAQSLVRESYKCPIETFETNVMGTASVLEAVRVAGRPCVVIVATSDKCYENFDDSVVFVEADPLGGHDPYSASKGAAEILISSYRRSFFPPDRFSDHGVALASVRAGNVIGGGDWATDRIIPDIMRGLSEDRPPKLRNPQAIRPWQHVLDVLSGYLLLGAMLVQRGARGLAEAWNFGPIDPHFVSVDQLTERFLRAWGKTSWRLEQDPGAPHETKVLRLDSSKAVRKLGWKPIWNVDVAIDRTVSWYQKDR
ncbi:MAG: CDP-glucose 4,6-dehydratase, partial [Acidimicrobiia bacterium]